MKEVKITVLVDDYNGAENGYICSYGFAALIGACNLFCVTAIQLSNRSPYSIANRFIAGFQFRKGIVQRSDAFLTDK